MKFINTSILLLLFGLIISSCQESPVEPEEQFVQIYFKYDFRNELNTFENTYQKDLILDGVIKVPFWLTAEEQNKILNKVNEVDFFSMPDTFQYSSEDSIIILIPDPGEQILRIKYEQKDKTIIWSFLVLANNQQFNKLLQFKNFIISIIESKPEYKILPPHRGGYL